MATLTKIKGIGLQKLLNAEYATFATQVEALVLGGPAAALGIAPADLSRYQALLALLNDIVAQSRTSDRTAQLDATDKERDDLAVYLLTAIRTACTSPIRAQREAAESLYNLTKPYISVQKLANPQETAMLKGLGIDLQKTENAAKIATLGLTDVVVTLVEVNEAYEGLNITRTSEVEAAQLEQSKVVRAEMTELYDTMTAYAYAKSLMTPSTATAQFITGLNATIDDTNAHYNMRIGQAKRHKEAEKAKAKADATNPATPK